MGLGVAEPKTPVVQGTIQLFDHVSDAQNSHSTAHLKHDKTGVVLAPQPSDDPNDPLNWPLWQRNLSFGMVLIMATLSLVHGPILTPVTVELSIQYSKSINNVAHLNSYMLLVIAACSYIYSVACRVFGKRVLFLTAGVILVASDAWAACASTYNSMLGARILSGAGQAMYETLGLAVVPDLFYVHERGTRITLFLFLSQTGVTLGVPITTQIANRFDLRSCFIGLAVSEAIAVTLIFFFFYECAYPRGHTVVLAHRNDDGVVTQVHDGSLKHQEISHVDVQEQPAESSSDEKPVSYLRKLRPWSPRLSKRPIWTLTWHTLALSFHPTIFYTAVAGLPLSWPVGISFTMALLLVSPPYSFASNAVGNMYIAAWIGTTLSILIGSSSDYFVKRLAKLNKNVYEPEFRLWYLIPGTILWLIGWIGWGLGAQVNVSWVALAVSVRGQEHLSFWDGLLLGRLVHFRWAENSSRRFRSHLAGSYPSRHSPLYLRKASARFVGAPSVPRDLRYDKLNIV
ncbi:uncharacterized protein A1O5_00908 [Cladophialophora psammophila CBS 110553]|uniref:Major facilitator superfamily (MFS) profile domain-containing protein n=1 Tax=Cladophialophora psammophila CBS 110553 TaxID=1182543 RepID=W9XGE7_9EURO|nr:uncharacterized protein A1O5_00908 [Cladophialophora psammophila CBS 110553]EXJ76400.1 hypothetical protein A1O5_00908 [Cladophialophora psammophila CBS 110553]